MSLEKQIARRDMFIRPAKALSIAVEPKLHIDLSHPAQMIMYYCPGNVASIILLTQYRIFSEHRLDKIHIRHC